MAVLKFLGLLRLQWQAALWGLLASLCSSLASIGLMATAGWFLSAMAAAFSFGILLNLFVPSALIRLLAIARTALRYVDRLLSHRAAFILMEQMRLALFATALRLEHEAQVRLAQADLERRLHSDIEKLELAFIRQFEPAVVAFVVGALVSAILASFSYSLLFCFICCFTLAGFFIPALMALAGHDVSAKVSSAELKLHHETADFIRGLFDITVLGVLGVRLTHLQQKAEQIARLRARLSLLEGLTQSLLLTLAALCFLGVLYSAGTLYLQSQISVAQTMMLAIGALACFECLQPLSAAFLTLPETAQAATRVLELINGKVRKEGSTALNGPLTTITCTHLSLGFTGKEPLITDFSFTFKAKCNYAIQGPLGSGKSTLLHALCGLIAPQDGEIYYNNLPGTQLSPHSLHRQVSMCLQDPCFISGTVRQMFCLMRPQCSSAQIEEALAEVELRDFVLSLPDGLDSYVGREGHSLSGGQARRLSLALTLFKCTPFVLLDEPGEGLDATQEKRILTRILQRRRGVIMVTHKQVGVNLCDNVLIFERISAAL